MGAAVGGGGATATRLGLAISSLDGFLFRAGLRLIGDGDRAMLPTEAFSSSTEGAAATRSDGSGLILILNFFLWSSSPSDSSEEKKWGFLTVGAPSSDSSSGLML